MALLARAARGIACGNCRQWALRSFIASIGGPCAPPRPRPRTLAGSSTRYNEARIQQDMNAGLSLDDVDAESSKSALQKGRAEAEARRDRELETEVENEAGGELGGDVDEVKDETAYVPWYLQVDSPVPQQERPLSGRQTIPDLPEHSPEMLAPLLQRVSVELGMDDLVLLDLRELDPPPAMGANLFMLVGTARSEKHLHVAADKLCRWLRSEYRLTPSADGLLGRQELKVKMRRKAKKSKLLSAAGAKSTASAELDEGVRTGWVCVNVGRIDGGELPPTEADVRAQKNMVGFGTRTRGCHIVVQLMTEEKREEIALEALWSDVLWRSKKTKAEQARIAAEEAEPRAPCAEQSSNTRDGDARAKYDPAFGTKSPHQAEARL